ncbi:aromatic/alkene monooxygenase hydroxylase FAD-binding subunit MmoC [Methylobacter sp. YRD-M1]|uniref:aromatic/alkene monooxygenase hydroxylase FAD-binding subunit MmoC n=1 Tax=Methylobacter sp. YRD-M1 TaxID=2911520 RepID=UPI00227C7E88|nr:2Fe-2S iron-sulfur cluster binding domain-containing protein [Methylobacter sp. YRD-M1]WAK02276.1 2Fe-2S iron-sulfur cluster binding domain-containing protein [Methylobacter sp. YRD-M1]
MSTHTIELTTRDGEQLRFNCDDDRNLLEAAADARIVLPSQCRQGSCGACYADVTRGDYSLGEHNPAALSAGAAERGGILLCRTFPLSDLSIALPFDHDLILRGEIRRREAAVAGIEPVGENTVRLTLLLAPDEDGASVAEFEPGQFMELEVPEQGIRRAYSLSNTGNWEGRLEFLIRLQPGGLFSTWLREQAHAGKTLTVHGPQGAFVLCENGFRPRWFVAGGTGLAPMLSMLRRMAAFQEPHPVRLYFGVNRTEELFCLAELEALKAELPQLQVTLCVWKPNQDWQGFCGTPADALAQDLSSLNIRPDIYLCGPPALIDAAEAAARAHGVPGEQVFSEKFLPA